VTNHYFSEDGTTVHEMGTGRPLLYVNDDTDTYFRHADGAAVLYFDVFGECLYPHRNRRAAPEG